ncbi:hypothetical protein GCM10007160_27940 [Litchfieldella qijiaojingensis]|uniref:Uncharacterized protein n=1 Tax=Litchfieldella qijiaojingensis TaxID=980347 RepID=A0ABQ2Z177_9GAMM|nr:hypothetical protein [Halomonas qijiaojingensis]GGX98670.1 hypothetical protein GCM10007160_27940 [Halomonas qijiaojingensis]
MNLGKYQNCACRKMGNTQPLCLEVLTLGEQGKQVRLMPKAGEQAVAVVLDGCVLCDNQPKCDGLFLWQGNQRNAAVLVELKGAGDIPHAFEQLAYMQRYRQEYRELVDYLHVEARGRVMEKAVVVTNGMLSKPERERLEDHHGIRVMAVLHCEATSPIPDLRDYL